MIKQFGSGENWQKKKTFEWIEKMLNEYPKKDILIFEGQTNLNFIKDGFSKKNFSNYEIILIDCNKDTLAKRLIKDRNQPELLNKDMQNWLKYLRNQAKNFKVNIINTSSINKHEVVKSFEKILRRKVVL